MLLLLLLNLIIIEPDVIVIKLLNLMLNLMNLMLLLLSLIIIEPDVIVNILLNLMLLLFVWT